MTKALILQNQTYKTLWSDQKHFNYIRILFTYRYATKLHP